MLFYGGNARDERGGDGQAESAKKIAARESYATIFDLGGVFMVEEKPETEVPFSG